MSTLALATYVALALALVAVAAVMCFYAVRRPTIRFRGYYAGMSAVMLLLAGYVLWMYSYGGAPATSESVAATATVALATWMLAVSMWLVMPQALTLPTAQDTAQALTQEVERRRGIESVARVASAHFHALVDAAHEVGLIATNLDGVVSLFNPGAERLLGTTSRHVLGTSRLDEIIHLYDSSEPRRERGRRGSDFEAFRAWASQLERPMGEVALRRADGTIIWCDLSLTRVVGEDGIPFGYLAVLIDVSARRRALQLARSNEVLEAQVSARAEELAFALQRAEESNLLLAEANTHKSRFLSVMSHEFRTPLNGILGFADLLRHQYYGALNPKQADYVEMIQHSGEHLLALVNDLLDIVRIDAGAIELRLERFDVEAEVRQVVDMAQPSISSKWLDLRIVRAPELTHLVADRQRFRQVILNLLSNAVKYTPEGGHIVIHCGIDEHGMARFEVCDTGIGIDPDKQQMIFSEFYQSERARDQEKGGVGIGLALTRRLVELHGGEITVESYPGLGSKFVFLLPQRPDFVEVPGEPEPGAAALACPRGLRILIVDDNPLNLAMLRDMLALREMTVESAANGRDAVALVPVFQPDLILLDLRMPGMDGFETLRAIRALEYAMPVMAVSASAEKDTVQRCYDEGFAGHLAKPFTSSELVALLAHAVPASREETLSTA